MKQSKYVGESMKASAAMRASTGSGGHKYPKMTAGGASGPGRLEKAKAYGKNSKAK